MSKSARALEIGPLRRFKPYPAYKDSNVEWLGEIPANWQVKRADSFLRYDKIHIEPSEISEELVFHYSIPSVQETGDGVLQPPSEIDSAKLGIVGERLLVSKLNPRKGVVLIASAHDVPTICSTEFVPFAVRDVDVRWALYLFLAESTQQRLSAMVRSATRSHQRAEVAEIAKMWHGVPSLPEQRAIAAFLDQETARIDALVAKKERLIELLEEKRSALITRAVTKGLDRTVPMKSSGVEWLEEIPAHWGIKRLKHVTSKIGSGKTPSGGAHVYVSSGIMLIRSQNVHFSGLVLEDVAYIDSEIDAQMASSRVQEGDVLLNITGASLGRCCVAHLHDERANVNQHVCVIRPKKAAYIPQYLAAALASHSGQAQIFKTQNGISRDALTFAQVGELIVPQPPLQEQRAIVNRLQGQAARIDALIDKVRAAIGRLKELRTALISAAVTGKIDVREEVA